MNNKKNRLEQQITKQLAMILRREVRDPRLGLVTITEVQLNKDQSLAKIYITSIDGIESVVNKENIKNDGIILLNKMAGFLRTELASKLQVRNIPVLKFYYDTVIDKSNRIDALLDDLNKDNINKKEENP